MARRRASKSRRKNPTKKRVKAYARKAGISYRDARGYESAVEAQRRNWLPTGKYGRQYDSRGRKRKNPDSSADQMVLEAMAMGSVHRNLDAAMDVEMAIDEGMCSPSVAAKARAWLKGGKSSSKRSSGGRRSVRSSRKSRSSRGSSASTLLAQYNRAVDAWFDMRMSKKQVAKIARKAIAAGANTDRMSDLDTFVRGGWGRV